MLPISLLLFKYVSIVLLVLLDIFNVGKIFLFPILEDIFIIK